MVFNIIILGNGIAGPGELLSSGYVHRVLEVAFPTCWTTDEVSQEFETVQGGEEKKTENHEVCQFFSFCVSSIMNFSFCHDSILHKKKKTENHEVCQFFSFCVSSIMNFSFCHDSILHKKKIHNRNCVFSV